MIKILAREQSRALEYLCDKLNGEIVEYDLFISKSHDSSEEYLRGSIGCDALIMLGTVGDMSALFAETFGLSMFYDKFAERNVKEYCKLSNLTLPAQHAMDKLCIAPETFNHYACSYGCQCTCYGEYKKTHVYMVPDELRECSVSYENYIYTDLFKNTDGVLRLVYKVFGLSAGAVSDKLEQLGKYVSRKCETINLDTKIILTFPPKCSKSAVAETDRKVKELFGSFLYANSDCSLARAVVDLMKKFGKRLSTAESMTGGLIASTIVDIEGASSVLYEGVVTYSVPSKCARLGLNPHFIDEHGVVSQQVAEKMARGLIKNGTDVAVSVTGYAGPTATDNMPVGLCYIGIATENGVSVYRNIFSGSRNNIRAQATNMALYLVLRTLTK